MSIYPGGGSLVTEQSPALRAVGFVDESNSTTTALDAGLSFTGEWVDVSRYASISVSAATDAGVAGQVTYQFSRDGVNVQGFAGPWPFGASGSIGVPRMLVPTARYGRVLVENTSGSNQTTLGVQTMLSLSARIAIPTSRITQTVDEYTDVLNTRAVLFGADPSGAYRNANLDEGGDIRVTIGRPLTAFGELRQASIYPIAQVDAVYGVLDNVETLTASGGTATTANGNFTVTTGVSVGGYGVIRTLRAIRYRPGQGSVFRFTAGFDSANAVANSLQFAGPFNAGSGFVVGYNATQFGVMHRTGGRHEVRRFSISAAATGAETVSLELSGTTYNIPVTSGSAAFNAYEIAAWLNANQTVWDATQNGSTVVLFGRAVGPLSGAYSVSSTGTLDGTFSQDGAGVANTETWVYQAAFNVDPLDGTGPSGMTIDPATGNVYEVDMQYLGYGAVDMRIENPNTGRLFTFHQFKFANARTTPTLTNPTLKVGWIAASLGSTTNITVFGASAMGGVDGPLHPPRNPRAFSAVQAGVGSTITSVFAIRVRLEFNGVVQLNELLPRIAFCSPAGNKAAEVSILLDPTFDTGAAVPNWTYCDEALSIVEYDTAATTFTDTGTTLASFVVAGSGTGQLEFTSLGEGGISPVHIERGEVLCIAARIAGGAGSDVTASLTWLED